MDEIAAALSAPLGNAVQLQEALANLCLLLSGAGESFHLPTHVLQSLVRIAREGAAGPDAEASAVRAMTYYCELGGDAADALVLHGALPALLHRLRSAAASSDMDAAEECVRALGLLARWRPSECAGEEVVRAVLAYVGFFGVRGRRAAVAVLASACSNGPQGFASAGGEALHCLLELLEHDCDESLVESVAHCLAQIAASRPEVADELLRRGLPRKALLRIDGLSTQAGLAALVRLLTKLTSCSVAAAKALLELNVGRSLRGVLAGIGLSHGAAPSQAIYEVLSLVNELVPPPAASNMRDTHKVFAKEQVLNDHPDLLRQFAGETIPFLTTAATASMSLQGRYVCVSIMHSIASLAKPSMLRQVLAGIDVAAFLASLLARTDRHLLFVTAKVVEVLMKKLSEDFLDPFVKQGVLFALDKIAKQPRGQEPTSRPEVCLCYILDSDKSRDASEKAGRHGKPCRVNDQALSAFARIVKQTYFTHEALCSMAESSESAMQSLQGSCKELDAALVESSKQHDGHSGDESQQLMSDLLMELYCSDDMTPFEFLQTGLVWSVANYLCSGKYLKGNNGGDDSDRVRAVTSKFQSFASVCLTGIERDWETTVLAVLVRKLQDACSCLDIFEDALKAAPPAIHDPMEVEHPASEEKMDGHGAGFSIQSLPFFSSMVLGELAGEIDTSSPLYDTLFVLKVLEGINRFAYHILSEGKTDKFARGAITRLDDLKSVVTAVPRDEFVNATLTGRLEHEMQQPSFSSATSFKHLLSVCPFLASFDARLLYFRKTAFGPAQAQDPHIFRVDSMPGQMDRLSLKVDRRDILKAAAEMMKSGAARPVEIQFHGELGFGAGPTAEFYTLASHEFQKSGHGMWRGESDSSASAFVVAPGGLFPRPRPPAAAAAKVSEKFHLLGQFAAKAVKDGQVLDIPFCKAFYKLVLGQKLTIYDIKSFDPELGKTLLEFRALAKRREFSRSGDLCFRGCQIEDLGLDFGALPGYPEYPLQLDGSARTVTIENVDEYVQLVLDATIGNGIAMQVEAFKCGFGKVFPVAALQVFSEEELEQVVCGEQDGFDLEDMDAYVTADHGYTMHSTPVVHLLDILTEFDCQQRRAFLQFVTGSPRLPPGGLGALDPKLTVVCKHSDDADAELPSVMTCTNYLKLPPYSSKNTMRRRLLYAITEGQGSFDFS